MSSHADYIELRQLAAENRRLLAENQQLREALRRISDYGPMPLEVRRIANHALAAVGEK